MKRCPECGFRANDTVCPLCGVKMRGYSAPIRSHSHTQPGEKCVLPNQNKPSVKPASTGNAPYRPDVTGTRRQRNAKPNFGVVIFIIIMFILLRSCAWL